MRASAPCGSHRYSLGMSVSYLLDEDPITGIRQIFHYDDEDGMTIEEQQEVSDIVDVTKAEHRQFDERTPWKGDWHKVASIPMSLFGELQKQGIVNDQKAFKKWLNDRDNQVFRTRPGRV